jgi:hypothetical protein
MTMAARPAFKVMALSGVFVAARIALLESGLGVRDRLMAYCLEEAVTVRYRHQNLPRHGSWPDA